VRKPYIVDKKGGPVLVSLLDMYENSSRCEAVSLRLRGSSTSNSGYQAPYSVWGRVVPPTRPDDLSSRLTSMLFVIVHPA
jgi:hypothetical protein